MTHRDTALTDTVIDLRPVATDAGAVKWTSDHCAAAIAPPDVPGTLRVADGTVYHDTADRPAALSTVPADRMAGQRPDWNEIIDSIRQAETSRDRSDREIAVQPGGALVPVDRGQKGPELSTVPEDIMAAPARATRDDLAEARRLDPHNVEQWDFIDHPMIPGLRFTLIPVSQPFTFFCFRDAAHGGRWFLAVLDPNLDRLIGHEHHMITATVGGERIPVVCSNPGDSSHGSLTHVRGAAGKFALYHSVRAHGRVPFSV